MQVDCLLGVVEVLVEVEAQELCLVHIDRVELQFLLLFHRSFLQARNAVDVQVAGRVSRD